MLSPELEHRINQIAEARLDRAWEEYNAEGPAEEEDNDFYAEADRLYDYYQDREVRNV